MRAPETGEGRNQVDAAGGGALRGQRFEFGCIIDDPEAVAEPLHRCAGGKHRSFQGIRRLRAFRGVKQPGDGREQAVHRLRQRAPDIHEHERARAVGVLGIAGLEGGLPEQRGLLITCHAGHGYSRAARRARPGHAEGAARRANLGQGLHRHTEQLAQLAAPIQRADVEQHRPRGVRGVGGVHRTAGQVPDDPAVDRADRQIRSGLYVTVAQQPLEL